MTASAPERIRVVHCLSSFDTGGTELNAVRTMEQIDQTRFDVRCVCLSRRGPLIERVQRIGIPIIAFEIDSLVSARALRVGWRLARWLRREHIRVFHAHDVYANIFGVPWARVAGVPLVIASRRWWMMTNRPSHRVLNRCANHLAHRVLANSESVAALLTSAENVAPAKVWLVHNFVDDQAFVPPSPDWIAARRAELGIAAGDVVVGCVANLLPIKDHAMLVRAFAGLVRTCPHARLVLVGEGPEERGIIGLAESLGVRNHVCLAGRRPNQPSMHWLFDVTTLASESEGLPNSIVEAMAAARPTVATRVGGVPDAVTDGVTGILVPAGDVDAMARALTSLVNDPVRARAMGEAAAQQARARYHVSRVMSVVQTAYGESPRTK